MEFPPKESSLKEPPSRGPLLSLFIRFCLRCIIIHVEESRIGKQDKRLKVREGAPTFSHMFFIDDIILLAKVDQKEVVELLQILNLFSKASSQRINTHK